MLGKNGFPSSAIPVSVTMKQAASVRVFTILPISALKKQLERMVIQSRIHKPEMSLVSTWLLATKLKIFRKITYTQL